MATKQFWVLTTTASSPNFFGSLQDGGSAPAATLSAYGWTPTSNAVGFYRARLGASAKATVRSATSVIDALSAPQPGTGSAATTAGDSFISPTNYTGDFASGNWSFSIGLRPTAITCTGRLRFKVYASVNADGSSARTLTSSTLVTNIVTLNSTTTTVVASVTWAAPAVKLTNEYLFFQCEWEETTIGSASSALAFRLSEGSITTTDYVPGPFGTLQSIDAGTTWSPTDKNAITLSSDNLTATFAGGAAFVRSVSANSRKLYFEGTIGATSSSFFFGVGTSTATSNTNAAVVNAGGAIFVNAIVTGISINGPGPGSVLCVAADIPNRLIWFRLGATGSWNATSGSAKDPATGVGGVDMSALAGSLFAYFVPAISGNAITANFGASSFVGAIPSGFTAWDGGPGTGDVAAFGPASVAWTGTLLVFEGTTAPTADSETYYADSTLVTADAVNPGDAAAFAGTVALPAVTGTLAVTEGADTAAFTGTVAFAARTGTLAATEGADVSAFTGTVAFPVRTGTLAATEGVDTASFAGSTVWTGALAAVEVGAETASFGGSVAWPVLSGTLTATEARDASAFAGTVAWRGALVATEGADVFASSGTVANLRLGVLDATEESEIRASSTLYTADDDVTQVNTSFSGDVAEFRGFIPSFAVLAATEGPDVSSIVGEVFDAVTRIGSLQAYEDRFPVGRWPTADSTVYTVDQSVLTADISLFSGDAAHFTGAVNVVVIGVLDAHEERHVTADSDLITADSSITVDTVGDIGDVARFTASIPLALGVLAAVEEADSAEFTDAFFAVLAAQEGSDIANFFYTAPAWDDLRDDAGLRNEVQRMIWLSGLGGRVTWLEGEVEDISQLENLDPGVISLTNEVERIGTLGP